VVREGRFSAEGRGGLVSERHGIWAAVHEQRQLHLEIPAGSGQASERKKKKKFPTISGIYGEICSGLSRGRSSVEGRPPWSRSVARIAPWKFSSRQVA
jgi:hypothetical protein